MNFLQNSSRFAAAFCRPTWHLAYSTVTKVAETSTSTEPDKLYKIIQIEIRANESEVMKSYEKFARMAAEYLDINIGQCYGAFKPKHERDNLTLLRSCFANKDCRVQYETRTYFRYMNFHHLTGSTADTFLEYIERNLPEGVAMKITKVAVEKLPEEISTLSNQLNEDESGSTSSENKNE